METIYKTWKKATYFEGNFKLRSKNENWAKPIEFPTVFTAYGAAIKSGNWQSCMKIKTPSYVIDNYFDSIGNERPHSMFIMWEYCKQLEKITWKDVHKNESSVLEIIKLANKELSKLKML